jgi:hypothetical protein
MPLARRTFRAGRIDHSLGDANQPVSPSQRNKVPLRRAKKNSIPNDIRFSFSTSFLRDISAFISVQKFFKKVKKRLVSPDFCS